MAGAQRRCGVGLAGGGALSQGLAPVNWCLVKDQRCSATLPPKPPKGWRLGSGWSSLCSPFDPGRGPRRPVAQTRDSHPQPSCSRSRLCHVRLLLVPNPEAAVILSECPLSRQRRRRPPPLPHPASPPASQPGPSSVPHLRDTFQPTSQKWKIKISKTHVRLHPSLPRHPSLWLQFYSE